MTQTLYGIHDSGGEHLMTEAGRQGWVVTTHSLLHDQFGYNYSDIAPHTPIARLNWGYGADGTVPIGECYNWFGGNCAEWVAQSQGCHHWIIGNEPNHENEWPHRQPITPERYAGYFSQARAYIRELAGHEDDRVLVAGPAPWNVWHHDGVILGWVEYLAEILDNIDECDGLALHTYTHRHDHNFVYFDGTMAAPWDKYHFEFMAYRDFLTAVPSHMRHLPVYITETDATEPWHDENRGWVQAAYGDINWWNMEGRFKREYTGTCGAACNKIHALCLYRWQNLDKWGMCDKQGVHDDFRAAMEKGFVVP